MSTLPKPHCCNGVVALGTVSVDLSNLVTKLAPTLNYLINEQDEISEQGDFFSYHERQIR